MRIISSVLASLILSLSFSAHALRDADFSGDDTGAVAVYQFNEGGGDTAYDTSGVGAPLNLKMSNAGNLPTADGTVIRTNAILGPDRYTGEQVLLMNPKVNGTAQDPDSGYQAAQRHRTFLVSEGPATKLNSCTNGMTIQVFVRPWFPRQGSGAGNMIVGLSNSEGLSKVAPVNFGVYQTGETGDEAAMVKVRTSATSEASQSSVAGGYSSVREGENLRKWTEIIATRESNGILSVYINRMARSSVAASSAVFSPNAKLVVGNELVPLTTRTVNGGIDTYVEEQRNWSGEIKHIAIYCRGFSRAEILGALEENKTKAEVVRPMNAGPISVTRQEARKMVERLSGSIVPIDHPMVAKVEQKLLLNDRVGAAKIVTGDLVSGEPGHPDFLNTVVKQMAMKMSNREETIRAPLNDFAASFVGITRDERSAKELLTGDFFYMANPAKAKVRSDIFRDLLTSNNHFEDLEKYQWDLGKVLMRVPGPDVPAGFPSGQMLPLDATGTMAQNADPAGVITSRAFMAAHAVAGTNRRLVEYAFKSFMCVPMSEMADTSASPARIGRDIDRLPGGDAVKFETSCKGCHTVMDGFRGAFARFDFTEVKIGAATYGVVRNTQVNKTGSFRFMNGSADSGDVVRKMNHNENVFPNGFQITDDSFVNNAVGVANKTLFGWGGSRSRGGVGVNQFGQMIADSTRFSQCMAKRVYETVCLPGGKSEARVSPLVQGLAIKFQESGYKLRTLFQEAAANPNCAANMGR